MKQITALIACIFIMTASLQSNTSYAKPHEKEILYHAFPALDSVLCILAREQFEKKQNKYIYAHLEYAGNYVYRIYIDGRNDNNMPKGYSQVVKPGNRYLKICGKKIPVFLEEYDNLFADPPEKDFLPGKGIWHGVIVTFNAVEQKILSIE